MGADRLAPLDLKFRVGVGNWDTAITWPSGQCWATGVWGALGEARVRLAHSQPLPPSHPDSKSLKGMRGRWGAAPWLWLRRG